MLFLLSACSDNSDQERLAHGQELAQSLCGNCHDLSASQRNRQGPYLWRLIGRKVGSTPGYPHSNAHTQVGQTLGLAWTQSALAEYLYHGPDQTTFPLSKFTELSSGAASNLSPAQLRAMRMALGDAQAREDLALYLASLGAPEGAADAPTVANAPTAQPQAEATQRAHSAPAASPGAASPRQTEPELAQSTAQEAQSVSLRLLSNPPGAATFFEGRRIGVTPVVKEGLKPGYFRVRMVLPGHHTWERVIQAGDSPQTTITAQLTPIRHRLDVHVEPNDADIRFSADNAPYQPAMTLPPDRYEMRISHSGYLTQEVIVDLTNQDQIIHVALEPLAPIPPSTQAPLRKSQSAQTAQPIVDAQTSDANQPSQETPNPQTSADEQLSADAAPPLASDPIEDKAADAAKEGGIALAANETGHDADTLRKIADLLARGEQNLQADRLSSPPVRNAVARFEAVLALQPDNLTAKAGLLRVVDRYIELAAAAQSNKERTQLLERASRIAPDDPRLRSANGSSAPPAVIAPKPETPPAPATLSPMGQSAPQAPSVQPSADNDARIGALLDGARADLKALRLASPTGENAIDKLLQIFDLDPNHAKAKQLMTQVGERYLQLAGKQRLPARGWTLLGYAGVVLGADASPQWRVTRQEIARQWRRQMPNREKLLRKAENYLARTRLSLPIQDNARDLALAAWAIAPAQADAKTLLLRIAAQFTELSTGKSEPERGVFLRQAALLQRLSDQTLPSAQ
ncbi:PEGA domain-containing protein [Magnetofaba australis]|uniref:PEGA domain-containing protein n=1 Tax=Magnetofaba australis TaxID=1472297 RepID=UPI001301AD38|nr:PEGA domain-containing protein [Magnetofaba australis]